MRCCISMVGGLLMMGDQSCRPPARNASGDLLFLFVLVEFLQEGVDLVALYVVSRTEAHL